MDDERLEKLRARLEAAQLRTLRATESAKHDYHSAMVANAITVVILFVWLIVQLTGR